MSKKENLQIAGKFFKAFDPIKDKMLQILDNKGKVINEEWKPELEDTQIVEAYKNMMFARQMDLMTVSYQRQGRMYTYPPNLGQEAISVAAGTVMRKDDWLVPAYRELGAWLLKGTKPRDIFLYWRGHEDGSQWRGSENFIPSAVPIASQLLHAAGIGYAIKYKKEKKVVFTFMGDGGTSEGDFHEALNFASNWKAPVVFINQNNQYAISFPVHKQTSSKNIAIKSYAYGMPGVKVDGNDFLAVYRAVSIAAEYARSGKGPVLIECVTYRRGSHTTSDDPSLYRTPEEEKNWQDRDPISRLQHYLISKKVWKEKDDEKLLEQYKKQIDAEFLEAENYPPYKLEDVFQFHYAEMPEDLKQQKLKYEKFIQWKDAQR